MPFFPAHLRRGQISHARILPALAAALLLSTANADSSNTPGGQSVSAERKPASSGAQSQERSASSRTSSSSSRLPGSRSTRPISSSSRELSNGSAALTPDGVPTRVTGTSDIPSRSPRRSVDTRSSRNSQKLSWQPPLTREDGSSLYPGEIQGYRIYFKKTHHSHFQSIPLKDASKTTLVLDGFSPGVYHFSISTIDTNGLESRRSTMVRVNVT